MSIPIPFKINNAHPKYLQGFVSYSSLDHCLWMKTVLDFTIVPNPFWIDLQYQDVNWAPQYDMMDKGMP